MGRFIILVEKDENTVVPILNKEGPLEDCLFVAPTKEAAEAAADDSILCSRYGYTILDLEDGDLH